MSVEWDKAKVEVFKGPFIFSKRMKVKDLKQVLSFWPDTNKDGSDTEVWIETSDGISNQVKTVWPLNEADLLLEA